MDDRRPTPQPTRAVRLLVLLVVACALLATACTDLDGERITPLLGERVTVTVTASAGEDRIVRHDLRLDDGMTALDALMMVADAQVTPNGTVQLVNGRGGGVIRDLGPEPAGWFYRINGMEADMPANLYKLRPGDSLWWDLRRWDAYPVIPVAVGGFPQMVFAGYRDVIRPTRIAYEPEFVKVSEEFEKLLEQVSPERRKLQHESLLGGSDTDKGELVATVAVEPQRTNIAIGTWEELRLDPFISEIAFNPRPNGLTVWWKAG